MNIVSISCFIALAEELHFGRAAARAGMSQPPFSRHIRALEEAAGVRLFARTSRTVEMTAAGTQLLAVAQAAVRSYEAFENALGSIGKAHLRVGYVTPALGLGLDDFISQLASRLPQAQIELVQMGTREQLERISKGTLEIAFVRPFEDGAVGRMIASDHYVLAIPSRHELAARATVGLSHLRDRGIILFPRCDHPGLYDRMIAALARRAPRARIVAEPKTKLEALALVEAGMGIAILPSSVARFATTGVVIRDLADDLLPPVLIHLVKSPDLAHRVSAAVDRAADNIIAKSHARESANPH